MSHVIPEALVAKLKTLPNSPGVYFHKNKAGEIIYVGKAAVLKNRVRQYFHKDLKDPKTEALKDEIFDTDWIVVDTEMDALFLESEMIKRYMPKWNILLRDDKTVSYVRIDMKSEVPTVTMTRQPLGDDARYIGPFYAKNTIATALRILRRVFPYYDRPYNGKKTLNTDLELTPGIEIGKTTPAEYKKSLRKLIRYLEGDREKLIREIENEMKIAANNQDFEKAAELRNQYFGLKGLKKKIVFSDKEFLDISSDQALLELQKVLNLEKPPRRIEGYDISHNQGQDVVASMVVFTNGASDRSEYRKFKMRSQRNDDFKNMRETLERRLRHKEWTYPDVILIDGGRPQLEALKDLLGPTSIPYLGIAKEFDNLIIPARFMNSGIMSTSGDYAELPIPPTSHLIKLLQRIRDESHRFAITYHRQLARKRIVA
ncbi:MAG: UvrB/UvrC motif-containing protein [Candidatus Saccharibacteria bacterium]|nr:UvrB/UvrC motif-containing protein [Candidatus Saccharibacteria bacterium]